LILYFSYETRFCNSDSRKTEISAKNDSFFVDGKPGNLARIFACIADKTNCESRTDVSVQNSKSKKVNKVKSELAKSLINAVSRTILEVVGEEDL
jgi:hypothetical protein